MDEEGTTWKRMAPSLPPGPSSMRSHTIGDGGQISSSLALADLPSVGHKVPTQGEGANDTAAMGAMHGADSETYHPTSKVSGGEDRELLQHLLVGVEV